MSYDGDCEVMYTTASWTLSRWIEPPYFFFRFNRSNAVFLLFIWESLSGDDRSFPAAPLPGWRFKCLIGRIDDVGLVSWRIRDSADEYLLGRDGFFCLVAVDRARRGVRRSISTRGSKVATRWFKILGADVVMVLRFFFRIFVIQVFFFFFSWRACVSVFW